MSLPMHLCGSIIEGMRMPRASRVEEVSATKLVPLGLSKKSVGKGRLCAPTCRMSSESEGKRILRDGEIFAPTFPLASVYMCVAESGTGGSGSKMGKGWS